MNADTDTGGCLGCIVLVALIFILIAIEMSPLVFLLIPSAILFAIFICAGLLSRKGCGHPVIKS